MWVRVEAWQLWRFAEPNRHKGFAEFISIKPRLCQVHSPALHSTYSQNSPVITAEPTNFRGSGEGTEGGHQHHPHLMCVLSPQTKANLPLAGHTRILQVESHLLTRHCPHLNLQLCHSSQPTSASKTGSPSFPWHGCCSEVTV